MKRRATKKVRGAVIRGAANVQLRTSNCLPACPPACLPALMFTHDGSCVCVTAAVSRRHARISGQHTGCQAGREREGERERERERVGEGGGGETMRKREWSRAVGVAAIQHTIPDG